MSETTEHTEATKFTAEDIAHKVSEYVRVNNEIKVFNGKLKALREDVKQLDAFFMDLFESTNKNEVKSDAGSIRVSKKITKKPIKINLIEDVLKKELTDPRTIAVVSKAIEEKREVQKVSKITLV